MSNDATPTTGPFEGYADEDRPLVAYTALIGLFNLLFAIFFLATKSAGRSVPQRIRPSDIALLGVATHKLSWLLAKDVVTSPLRAPFTEFQKMESPTSVQEKPRGRGLQRALGELLTCNFCIGQWLAAFFIYGLVLAPAVTRLVGYIFAVLTLSDFLHQAYKFIVSRA
jgi:hypothetical protein